MGPSSSNRRARPGAVEGGIALALLGICVLAACGKKGPPLPPLVKLPVAPANFDVRRRGTTVDVSFTVPASNTDNSRPANVARVDVYVLGSETTGTAVTAVTAVSDDELLKRSSRLASVAVKAPRDPDLTVDEDEPSVDMEPPEGAGLDQGATAHVTDDLAPEPMSPATQPSARAKAGPSRTAKREPRDGPLLPGPTDVPARTYIAVGVSRRGRRGPLSKRVSASLVAPPRAPVSPTIEYDEQKVTVKWSPQPGTNDREGSLDTDVLPSKEIGPIALWRPAIGYNVYDATSSVKLNQDLLTSTEFSDPRIVWGERRCYTVRAAETIGGMTVESEAALSQCETLVDTFPPSAPANVQSSPGEGAITLIWDANGEPDLAGYLVLRGAPGAALRAITPAPIQETTFRDEVAAGTVFEYAVQAVDKAGNASQPSNHVQESAR